MVQSMAGSHDAGLMLGHVQLSTTSHQRRAVRSINCFHHAVSSSSIGASGGITFNSNLNSKLSALVSTLI